MLEYNRYGPYLRDLFGCRVYKVSVDAGFTCPVLDGSKAKRGCAYCNNASFRAKSVSRRWELKQQIESGIARQKEVLGATKFVVYFQNFTNTYAPVDELRSLYEAALEFPDVVGLSIGTRPDCVDEPVIELLGELAERTKIWIELGLESSHDSTLTDIQRGHDYNCWLDAVWRMSRFPKIELATHVIFGLPGESEEMMLETIDRVSQTPVTGIKLHHLHVVKGTILAERYLEKPFPTYDLDDYCALLSKAINRLRKDVILFRIFGQCPEELLLAPHWDMPKNKTFGQIEKRLSQLNTVQGSECKFPEPIDKTEYYCEKQPVFEC